MGKFIPDDDRILLIEDTSEIQLEKPNLVRFEARQAQTGLPAVAIRDLLKASLRHRPDRIILGEIRGGEAFDLLQLLNTGHSGTLSTVHASSAKQAISRFTSCVLQSGVELPYRAIKTNIGDSLNVIIQLERRPGRRYVSQILEVQAFNSERDQYEFIPVYDEKIRSRNSPKGRIAMTQSSLQDAPTTAFVSSEIPLTVKEAARYLGVSPQTVYLWVERKQIPHLRVMGRNIRFLKSDLDSFRASFRQEMENA